MRATRFGTAMMGWGAAIEASAIVYGTYNHLPLFWCLSHHCPPVLDFPWDRSKKNPVVCDVGGGIGNISMQLAKQYPTLRIVLQDTPGQLEDAERNIWPQHCREAVVEKRVEFVPLDFFKESPKKGCDFYLVSESITCRASIAEEGIVVEKRFVSYFPLRVTAN